MNDSYFILINKPVTIERLHICTWDYKDKKGAIEIGIEFSSETKKDIQFKLALPFLNDDDDIVCLMDALIRDDDNSKFIFNDKIKANMPINGDKRNGAILEFEMRNRLAILPINDIEKEKGICSFTVREIQEEVSNYIRFYLNTSIHKIAVVNAGIAKTSYIYDIKINERRNLPDQINKLINNGFTFCDTINQCFCLHVVPSLYYISYVNSNKLKNIRMLEADAFNRYLPGKHKMKNKDYIIVFNKSKSPNEGIYTFFSEFEKEKIGNKQIILAVGANIFCSLLFGVLSFVKNNQDIGKLVEIGFCVFVCALILIFVPFKKIYYFLRRKSLK